MTKADKTINLKGDVCPYTLVKSKLALEEAKPGEVLEILLDHKAAIVNVPRSLKNEGYEILAIDEIKENNWRLVVRNK